MAYDLVWSAIALDDLHDIVVFIAPDNPDRAMSFGYELIYKTVRLRQYPEFGRVVPKHQNPRILGRSTTEPVPNWQTIGQRY
jgi:plasmid stabilization system protein ParE